MNTVSATGQDTKPLLFLKGLKPGGTPPLALTEFRWSLPTREAGGVWTPGEWAPKIKGRAIPCRRGYHLVRAADVSFWVCEFWELEVYVAETRGTQVAHGLDSTAPKVAVQEARLLQRVEAWNPTTLRLWLCDVAEHVLAIYENKHPDDSRVRACIEATRQYLCGEITHAQLGEAKRAAAAAYADAAANAGDKARQQEQAWQSRRLCELLGISEAAQ